MKIKLKEGVYADIKNVKIVFDLVDENSNAIENENIKQSPNSIVEVSGEDLNNIAIPSNLLSLEVFATE